MTTTTTEEEKPWAAWTAAAMLAKKPPGWWRRNVWGLAALLPLLAVVVFLRWDDIYWAYWRTQQHVPVNAAARQWVTFAGAEMRLVEFSEATGLTASGGKPFQPPPGVTPWKAVIEFKTGDQEALYGCRMSVEDTRERLFGMSPNELGTVRGISAAGCTASTGQEPAATYRSTVYFVLPPDAKPAAVRISNATELPRYARLTIAP